MPVFFSVEERDKKGKNMDEDGDADNGSPKNHIAKRYSVQDTLYLFLQFIFRVFPEQKTIPRILELRRIFKHSYAWSSHTLVCTDFH